MRSRKSQTSYDAARDFNRLSLSSEDNSSSARYAPLETARQATASLSAFAQSRGPHLRPTEERRPRPPTRHFLFNGHGVSEAVLSYFDPRAEEQELEKAIVA